MSHKNDDKCLIVAFVFLLFLCHLGYAIGVLTHCHYLREGLIWLYVFAKLIARIFFFN
jgi:hypothetical protein